MNKMTLLLTIFFQILIPLELSTANAVDSSPLAVSIIGSDVYVRNSYNEKGLNKVWRLKVNHPSSVTSSGVIDFVGERLIDSATIQKLTIPKYHKTDKILRYGLDESPPIWVNNKIVGGNHRINGKDTVHEYSITMQLDGQNVPLNKQLIYGHNLQLIETYKVSLGDGIYFARVLNEYSFSSGSNFCNFSQTVVTLREMDSLSFGGMQFQSVKISKGDNLILNVPGSKWHNGINITSTQEEFNLEPELWVTNSPPSEFILDVRDDQKVKRRFVMVYKSKSFCPKLKSAFYKSTKGKMYPKGITAEAPDPDSVFFVKGYFGFISAKRES